MTSAGNLYSRSPSIRIASEGLCTHQGFSVDRNNNSPDGNTNINLHAVIITREQGQNPKGTYSRCKQRHQPSRSCPGASFDRSLLPRSAGPRVSLALPPTTYSITSKQRVTVVMKTQQRDEDRETNPSSAIRRTRVLIGD